MATAKKRTPKKPEDNAKNRRNPAYPPSYWKARDGKYKGKGKNFVA